MFETFTKNDYGLVVVTPPCTLFSVLQFLGIGRSKESCLKDPEFQRRYAEAKVLLDFASIVCQLQIKKGRSFLFEQPWNARSWQERSIRDLLTQSQNILVRTDQCMFHQRDNQNQIIKKRTGS